MVELQVNAVTGSLFTSEVLQSAGQEFARSDHPVEEGDQVCISVVLTCVMLRSL